LSGVRIKGYDSALEGFKGMAESPSASNSFSKIVDFIKSLYPDEDPVPGTNNLLTLAPLRLCVRQSLIF
jgi:hypothetical protein